MSKYDNIKTATALVSEVKANGLSMETEDICRAQDILGGAPVEELIGLANLTGPAGKMDMQSAFYLILTRAWNWSEVVQFWNVHTNPMAKQFLELRDENERLRKENEELTVKIKEAVDDMLDSAEEVGELTKRIESTQLRVEEAETEVVRLKAKLYDLLVERKEAV